MERNLRLNWPAVVEAARRRRKAQKLTQQRLAAIAEISAPTVSRFESGDKNIQLSSALAILEALGLVERPAITFPDKIERHDPDRDVILFPGRTAAGEITCAVSGEALEDHFGARGTSRRSRLGAFRAHRDDIEATARRMLDSGRREPDGSVIIRSGDCEGDIGD